jgi:chromosome segregation ATPase
LTGGARFVIDSLETLFGEGMETKALLATLNETLRDVSQKLAQSDAVLMRIREELAAFGDILQHAKDTEIQASRKYEEVFQAYRELLANSNSLPRSYPVIEKIGRLSAEQARTHDEHLAAKECVRKYQEQVRVAELGLAVEESHRKSLQKAWDDLTWQIKKLSAARS